MEFGVKKGASKKGVRDAFNARTIGQQQAEVAKASYRRELWERLFRRKVKVTPENPPKTPLGSE